MWAYCRDLFVKVGFMSVHVRRGRLSVGTCSTRSGKCRYVVGEVGLVSGHVLRGRIFVGPCSALSA